MNLDLQLTREEAEILHKATTMFMALSHGQVSRHKMYKEESMDRLFEKMELYTNAGVVWVKISKALGVPEEVITEYLRDADI